MHKSCQHPTYGLIEYDENFFTGSKSLSINGVKLQKAKKDTFVWSNGENKELVSLSGNVVFGVTVFIRDEKISF